MMPVMVPIDPALLAPVEVVSSRTCLHVFGIDPDTFKRACKSGRIEGARHEGHTWYAPAAAVRAWFATLAGPAAPTPSTPRAKPADEADRILAEGPKRGRRGA